MDAKLPDPRPVKIIAPITGQESHAELAKLAKEIFRELTASIRPGRRQPRQPRKAK
jgi:hypothetical protein